MTRRSLSRSIVAFLFLIPFGIGATLASGVAAQDSTPSAAAPACAQPTATPVAIDKDPIIATVTADEDEDEDEDEESATAAADPEAESTAVVDETPVCSVTIEMVDIDFNPNEFTIPANQPVELVFHNTGKLPHDFTVEQLGVDVDADAGETESVTIAASEGDYQFFCDQPGHAQAGMVGVMHVVDQG